MECWSEGREIGEKKGMERKGERGKKRGNRFIYDKSMLCSGNWQVYLLYLWLILFTSDNSQRILQQELARALNLTKTNVTLPYCNVPAACPVSTVEHSFGKQCVIACTCCARVVIT